MKWDPALYLGFQDHRARPFFELITRIDAAAPRRVVDLGCGAGNLTPVLAHRWPDAEVEAVDSSPDMVEAARERGVDARVGNVRTWTPAPDTDVVVCNAVLHWVPEHRDLLRRWAGALPSGAWIAVQVPGNFAAPSHALPRELAAERGLHVGLLTTDAVSAPSEYASLLADAGCAPDCWETTYIQRLTGENAVLDWVSGTALRPVRDALDDEEWQRFRTDLAPRLRDAYPPRPDGTTWLPFRRIFAVARVR